jgi:hypothetical protein
VRKMRVGGTVPVVQTLSFLPEARTVFDLICEREAALDMTPYSLWGTKFFLTHGWSATLHQPFPRTDDQAQEMTKSIQGYATLILRFRGD